MKIMYVGDRPYATLKGMTFKPNEPQECPEDVGHLLLKKSKFVLVEDDAPEAVAVTETPATVVSESNTTEAAPVVTKRKYRRRKTLTEE